MPAPIPPESSDTNQVARVAPELSGVCASYLQTYRQEFADRDVNDGLINAKRYAECLDGLLGALFCAGRALAMDGERLTDDHVSAGRICLLAVGGYGRKTVAPHSDVAVSYTHLTLPTIYSV